MILEVSNLYKNFETAAGTETVEVLKDLNMSMEAGETVAILGQSGSGKSTLLTLLAGLDNPSSGKILLNEQNMQSLNEEELSKFRALNIGIIFQQFHLMSHLTALENVSLPLDLFKDDASTDQSQRSAGTGRLGSPYCSLPASA
jgi:putative ABC transport system ATP-binding protein